MGIIQTVKATAIKILKVKKTMFWKIKIKIVCISINKNKAVTKTSQQMIEKIRIKIVGNN